MRLNNGIFIFLLVSLFCLVPTTLAGQGSAGTTSITINNSHAIEVTLEVKCDYQWETKSYKYYKQIVVPKLRHYTIAVPNNIRSCEIWTLNVDIF